MFLNSDSVVKFLSTNGMGEKAQIGYDLTLKTVKSIQGGCIKNSNAIINAYGDCPCIDGSFCLKRGVYSITFHQGCTLNNTTAALIWHRSSLARIGCKIYSAIYDPGFTVDEMGAILEVMVDSISIELNSRVAQIVMFETESSELYSGRYQKEGDVK